MTAYELADEIDNFLKEEEQLPWGTKQVYLDMASTMIRQQAKRIEELEENLASLKHRYKALNHPHKELSDEEILEIMIDKGICGRLKDGSLCYWQADADLHDFARAIEERHGIK